VRDPGNEVDQYLVYNIETDLKLILPRRVPPARSAHGAAVYNQKLWVFAGYDGSMTVRGELSIRLSIKLSREAVIIYGWGGGGRGWHRREKGWVNKILNE
jgi:hypothetical protein